MRSREKIKKLLLRKQASGTGIVAKRPNPIYAESLAQKSSYLGVPDCLIGCDLSCSALFRPPASPPACARPGGSTASRCRSDTPTSPRPPLSPARTHGPHSEFVLDPGIGKLGHFSSPLVDLPRFRLRHPLLEHDHFRLLHQYRNGPTPAPDFSDNPALDIDTPHDRCRTPGIADTRCPTLQSYVKSQKRSPTGARTSKIHAVAKSR